MTIDITIGKMKIKTLDEFFNNNYQWNFIYDDVFRYSDLIDIEQCPDDIDGCTKKDTFTPNSAYRSGSITAIGDFFRTVFPNDLNDSLRPIKSQDILYTKIKPLLDNINKVEYNGDDYYYKKRLQWFKFWCNRAVELYGDKAIICFS